MTNFCSQRYAFGKEYEIILKDLIEQDVGESITCTLHKTDTKDYISDNYNIELKSRRFYKSDKYPDWLVPVSKFKDITKPLIIYYYWIGDATLWRYDYNPETLNTCRIDKSPISDQLHYYIPKQYFQKIEYEIVEQSV